MQQGTQKSGEKHEVSPNMLALERELKAANSPFVHGSQKDAQLENAKNIMREFNTLPKGKEEEWAKDVAKMANKSPDIWLPFLRENLKHQIVGPNYAQDTSAPSAEVLKYMVKNGMLDDRTNRAVNTELAQFGKDRSELRGAAFAD